MVGYCMTASSTLGHAAIRDLYKALEKVRKMLGDTEVIQWEIVKPIESLENLLDIERHQEALGFD